MRTLFITFFSLCMYAPIHGAAQSSTKMPSLMRDVARERSTQLALTGYRFTESPESAATTSAHPEHEGKEKKATSDAAQSQDAFGLPSQASETQSEKPLAMLTVRSLKDIAIKHLQEECKAQKKLDELAAALATIWIKANVQQNFQELLDDSYALLDSVEFFRPLYPLLATLRSSTSLQPSLTRPLLQNESIATRLCNLPLLSTLGTWPTATNIRTFNKYGYAAGDTKDRLYLVNCKNGLLLTIPHEVTDGRSNKASLFFSYDGAVLARLVHCDTQALVPHKHFKVFLYATTTGELIYSADYVGNNVNPSPSSPLFTYTDDEEATTIYNYRTKKATTYRLKSPTQKLTGHAAKISPQGTYSIFVIKNSDDTHDMYLYRNATGHHFFIQRISDSRLIRTWENSVKFNNTESMISLSDFYANTIKIFKIDELPSKDSELTPYFEIHDCQSAQSPLSLHFSPDGTHALIPTQKNAATLYDLLNKKPLKTFSDIKKAHFVAQNALLLTYVSDPKSTNSELYVHDTGQRFSLGAYPEFSQESLKVAYDKEPDAIYMLDIGTQQESMISKDSRNKSCFFDRHGSLFFLNNHTIEQLMIDPTDCTLEQLFFLLGLAHANEYGSPKAKIYTQLLNSSILTTFPPTARTYITTILHEYLNYKPAAPDTFFITPPTKRIPRGTFFDNPYAKR